MYNERIKEKFLQEIDATNATSSTFRRSFERAAEFEEQLSKDLCEFTSEEFIQLVDKVGGSSTHSMYSRLSDLKRYIRWASNSETPDLSPNASLLLVQEKDVANAINTYKRKYVKDPKDLKEFLDGVDKCNDVSQDFMGLNKIRRVLFWLAFSGMQKEDVENVRDSDVDIKHKMISYNSDVYPIYYPAIKDFQDLLGMKVMCTKKTSKKVVVQMSRADGDLLLRGEAQPSFISISTNFRGYIAAATKKDPNTKQLTYDKVRLSGIFFEAYSEELQTGVEPNFNVQAERELERSDKWAPLDGEQKYIRIRQRAHLLRKDYRKWKEAFDLIQE